MDAAPADPWVAPSRAGSYVIGKLLGRGGHGAVYEGTDERTGEAVAIKFLGATDPASIEAFKNEARFLADLYHPSLVAPDELLLVDGRLALVMQRVDGVPFTRALRGAAGEQGPIASPARVGGLVARLVRAVGALHDGGVLHLDLKPENVLVTGADEVVVLDFGLSRLAAEGGTETGTMVGTPRYMAPEQLYGTAFSEATDLYAVGVMVFEALSGAGPFDTHPDPVLARLSADAEDLAARRPGVDGPWADLCRGLLSAQPSRRPDRARVLSAVDTGTVATEHGSVRFVGRSREQEDLDRAWRDSVEGLPTVVVVMGDPGIGKTELLRRFARRKAQDGALIAAGRCYEREYIPYKAIDALLVRIGRWAAAFPEAGARLAADPRAAAIARVFPATGREAPDVDAGLEDRAQAWALAKEWLADLSRARPLLLVVDDAQWGDVDSLDFLAWLMSPPGAPRCLLAMAARGAEWGAGGFGAGFEDRVRRGAAFRTLRMPVGRLPDPEIAQVLAERLGVADTDPSLVEVVAAAGGNPLLASSLAADLGGGAFADRVRRRFADLGPDDRRLVLFAAVASTATDLGVIARAAGVPVPGRADLRRLRAAGWLCTAPVERGRAVVVFHDLVRQALLAGIGADERAGAHRTLAHVLAQSDGDPGAIAAQFAAGRAPEAAGEWALRGAAAAERVSAWRRAADLFDLALTTGAVPAAERDRVEERRAALLREAGQGRRAAELFLGLAVREGPTPRGRALRREAGDALLLEGAVDEGLECLGEVLAGLGLSGPRRGLIATLGLIGRLVSVLTFHRGLVARPHPDAVEAERSDTWWAVAKGCASFEPLIGLDAMLRALLHGLRSGDRARALRPAAFLAGGLFAQLPLLDRIATRWLGIVDEVARRTADPYAAAVHDLWTSFRLVSQGRLEDALGRGHRALEGLARQPSAAWERVQAASVVARVLRTRGEYVATASLALPYYEEAYRRGDLYGQVLFGEYDNLPALARGSAADARARIGWAREHWLPGRYSVQSFYLMLTAAYDDLYEGRYAQAGERLVVDRPSFRRAGGDAFPFARLEHDVLEARIALRAAEAGHVLAGLRALPELVRRIEGVRLPDARAHAALVRAGLHAQAGERDPAAAALEAAIAAFAEATIAMDGQAAALRLAELRGDADGARRARDAMRRLGASDPVRWAAIVAPGFTTQAS